MSIKVLVKKEIVDQFDKLPVEIKHRIKDAINELEHTWPVCRLDIKKLKGQNRHYRIRIGDFRILFSREDDVLKIYDILRRSNAYKE